MNEVEEWKSVVGYDGLYVVSNQGKVYSQPRKYCKGGYVKSVDCGNGYVVLCLCKNGKSKNKTLHTIVWEAFNGKIPKGYDVHHRNHIKSDNRLANLELVERIEHRKMHQRKVLQYTLDGQLINEYQSITEASKHTSVKICNITLCCQGNTNHKTAGGYLWKYKEVG